jgi:Zn finger protein HypA/HybF involved in hydrogenase expression
MHELSLAAEICRITERTVGPARAPRVVTVAIEIGDDAGVEPGNLEFCLGVLLAEPPFGHAAPRVTRTRGAELRVAYLEVDDDGPHD